MADQARPNANGHKHTSEPPRLYIAHHQATRSEKKDRENYEASELTDF